MIEWLDQFVGTRVKRRHLLYLITLPSCILFVLPYLFLGLRLLQLSDYPSISVLLKGPLIPQAYVSRIILGTISPAPFSFTKAVTVLLRGLRPFKVVAVLLFLLISPVVEKKRSTTVVLSAALLAAGSISFCIWQRLSSTSLAQTVVYAHCTGGILCVLSGVLLRFLFYYTCRQLKSYYLALQIQVEELEEQGTEGSLW